MHTHPHTKLALTKHWNQWKNSTGYYYKWFTIL